MILGIQGGVKTGSRLWFVIEGKRACEENENVELIEDRGFGAIAASAEVLKVRNKMVGGAMSVFEMLILRGCVEAYFEISVCGCQFVDCTKCKQATQIAYIL